MTQQKLNISQLTTKISVKSNVLYLIPIFSKFLEFCLFIYFWTLNFLSTKLTIKIYRVLCSTETSEKGKKDCHDGKFIISKNFYFLLANLTEWIDELTN